MVTAAAAPLQCSKDRTMPRPTKCTPEAIARFCKGLRLGCAYVECCGLAGISEAAWREWRTRGEAGEEPFAAFLAEATRAEAEGSLARMQLIRDAAERDWRAAAWIQERRYPERYGRHRVEVTGANGAAVQPPAQVVLLPAPCATVEEWTARVQTEAKLRRLGKEKLAQMEALLLEAELLEAEASRP